jgi:hypothetical protein
MHVIQYALAASRKLDEFMRFDAAAIRAETQVQVAACD